MINWIRLSILLKVIDLTLTISESIPTFPGSPKPSFIDWNNLKDDGYNMELLFLSSHTGTHMDAPFHFVKKGKKIHEINPNRFVSEAILIKIRTNKAITKTDIQKFEKKYGKIESGSTVVFYTGWQRNLKKDIYFTKNPGLSTSAANYLTLKKINLVGIDSPSIDPGSNSKFSAHQILSKKGILIVENLSSLEKIRASKFQLVVLPLKLKDATGSPVRAIALTG